MVNTSDGWTTALSIVALILAALVGGLTVMQGRTIRNIETREHKWQATDRKSAHIQVTRWRENLPGGKSGVIYNTARNYVRLTNTGRAPAHNVTWSGEHLPVPDEIPRTFTVMHPGEHFDLSLPRLDPTASDVATFTVSWEDANGSHSTERLIDI